MPRPLPPGGRRRRAVPLRLSSEEEAPIQAIAAAEHDGELSAAIRALLAEALTARARPAHSPRCDWCEGEVAPDADGMIPSGHKDSDTDNDCPGSCK